MEEFFKTQSEYYKEKADKANKQAKMWLVAVVIVFAMFLGCLSFCI